MRLLYLAAVYLAAPLISAMLAVRGLRDRSYWRNFGERLGLGASLTGSPIWVHAVSVGEVQAAAALVMALRNRYPETPVLVTTFTPTGAARARVLFRGAAEVRFLPFDLPGAVRRFLDRARPRLAVIIETELWPNLYRQCRLRRVPLVIASARLSRRSIDRYRRLGALFRETVAGGVVVAAQGEGDAERFRTLGAAAQRTHITGNLKFDLTLPPDIGERGKALREQYSPKHGVWVAGSTHGGMEEETVLEAHCQVSAAHPGALLVLAPRHPKRFGDVAGWLERQGTAFARRSQPSAANTAKDGPKVLLLDTMGELLYFYAAADVAFVGGSLAPIGGHNLLEPAALGLPVLTGPNNSNGEDVARLLCECGAAEIVRNGAELGARVAALLADQSMRVERGSHGRAVVDRNRGALEKLLRLIDSLLRS
ncbi:MAG TPA: lipid IV(A) 3-deoxy-D-manno-octulosonic acid transferase [Steroidobacteraceae bacterium]|jgi:3-deoxy-D-manno-octulosonic-acid transferase|nr:lipid IV(A) 3-deoxy-D-manno-octulosonic acid transferase [Steroidobacteraceae bacterium]